MTLFGCYTSGFAQNPIELEGMFQGKNLYVQNPFSPTGVGFCIDSIKVNNTHRVEAAKIKSTALEIDLIGMGFKKGDAVVIHIYHEPDCLPKVLNPVVH